MAVLATNMGLKFKPGYYPQFYSVDDEYRFYRHLGEVVRLEYREHPTTFMRVLADNATGFWVRGRTQKATMLNSIAGAAVSRNSGLRSMGRPEKAAAGIADNTVHRRLLRRAHDHTGTGPISLTIDSDVGDTFQPGVPGSGIAQTGRLVTLSTG